ncbi:sensor histidine kinase [Sungkyunkwania multivorans]|uniref:histidine kinase n=1 Tax=Sungkyunkwania multivorans TaxID=1173618 RepID=A0ABW3CWV2_9FLAO
MAQEKPLLDSLTVLVETQKYDTALSYWEENRQFFGADENAAMLMAGQALENLNKEELALSIYKKALLAFEMSGETERIAEVNYRIYTLLDSQNNLDIESKSYFENFIKYAKRSNDPNWKAKASRELAIKEFENKDGTIAKKHFLDAIEHYKEVEDTYRVGASYANIGLLFLNNMKQSDSARHYFSKGLIIAKEIKNNDLQWNILLNTGNSYKFDQNYTMAIEQYKLAKALPIKKFALKKSLILAERLQECYGALKDYKNSEVQLKQILTIRDSINLLEQNKVISEINTKYQTEKKEQKNQQLQQINRYLIIGGLAFIFLGVSIALLIQKNTLKKRRLAEQQQEIERQKVTTLLKEQELASIDAMITGQEKERQRVANELHDDLGSLMATVKLHFENIKADKEDPALKNTHKLLDKAYQKIRGIAHAKNAGVMASQGLLPAVTNMAKNISATNKIEIEVMDYGLEERMENSMELMIFRIIQELITNIIRHADAKRATIQFTQHDDSLNILIEDDGKGFDTHQIDPRKSGIGLNNIAKRIEHLEGSFTVDSILGKGTSIIIDIPL